MQFALPKPGTAVAAAAAVVGMTLDSVEAWVKHSGRYSTYKLPAGTDADLSHLQLSRSSYDGHPASVAWFGRR